MQDNKSDIQIEAEIEEEIAQLCSTSAEDVSVERQRLRLEKTGASMKVCRMCGLSAELSLAGICRECFEDVNLPVGREEEALSEEAERLREEEEASAATRAPLDLRGADAHTRSELAFFALNDLARAAQMARANDAGEAAIREAAGLELGAVLAVPLTIDADALAPVFKRLDDLRADCARIEQLESACAAYRAENEALRAGEELCEAPGEEEEDAGSSAFDEELARLRAQVEEATHSRARAFAGEAAALEKVAKLEEYIAQLRAEEAGHLERRYLLDLLGVGKGTSHAEDEQILSGLAPVLSERRAQRLKWSEAHDDGNTVASWTATLARLLAAYASELYDVDRELSGRGEADKLADASHLAAKIAATSCAIIESNARQLAILA